MWGTTVQLQSIPNEPIGRQTQQIARINYKRPETWSFWFGGQLTGGTTNTTGSNIRASMQFDLFLGVGRSVFGTKQKIEPTAPVNRVAFARFEWVVPPGDTPGQVVNNTKYTTQVRTPPLDDDLIDSFQLIEWFPSSDIQCEVQFITQIDGLNHVVQGEASAYFAPRSHVRPDWFQRATEQARFRGSEAGGS